MQIKYRLNIFHADVKLQKISYKDKRVFLLLQQNMINAPEDQTSEPPGS